MAQEPRYALGDGEPESDAGVWASGGSLDLVELVEDTLELICRDSFAVIPNLKAQAIATTAAADKDAAAGRGVVNRVGNEVPQDLRQQLGIAADRRAAMHEA